MVKGRVVREAGTAQGATRHHQQGTGLTGRAGPRLFTQVRTQTVFTRVGTQTVHPGKDPDLFTRIGTPTVYLSENQTVLTRVGTPTEV